MIINYSKEYIPAFGLEGIQDQMPVCRVVVLSLGYSKRDCAAYEGIVRSSSRTPTLSPSERAGARSAGPRRKACLACPMMALT